jgi:hypothetical protein
MGLWAWSRFEIAHKMESCKVVQTPFPTLPISTRRPPLHLPRRNGLSLVKLGPARLFECQKFTSRMRSTGIYTYEQPRNFSDRSRILQA